MVIIVVRFSSLRFRNNKRKRWFINQNKPRLKISGANSQSNPDSFIAEPILGSFDSADLCISTIAELPTFQSGQALSGFSRQLPKPMCADPFQGFRGVRRATKSLIKEV
jgi:hypothetical protein